MTYTSFAANRQPQDNTPAKSLEAADSSPFPPGGPVPGNLSVGQPVWSGCWFTREEFAILPSSGINTPCFSSLFRLPARHVSLSLTRRQDQKPCIVLTGKQKILQQQPPTVGRRLLPPNAMTPILLRAKPSSLFPVPYHSRFPQCEFWSRTPVPYHKQEPMMLPPHPNL